MARLLCLLLALFALNFAKSSILQGPTNKLYENGVNVTGALSCTVSSPGGVLWITTKRSAVYIGSGVSPNLFPDLYDFTTDEQTGLTTMTIKQLTRADSDTYICQLDTEKRTATIVVAGKLLAIL